MELLPMPPRTVRPSGGGRLGCLWVLVLTPVLIGVAAAAVVAVRLWVQYAGTPVTAVVTGRTFSRGSKSSSYHVQFRYSWDGRPVDDDQQVSREEYNRARARAVVPARVRVLAGHRICLAEVGSVGYQTVPYVVMAALLIGIPAAVGVATAVGRARRRHLVVWGTAVAGEVVDVRRESNGKSAWWVVRYRYPGPDGPVDGRATPNATTLQPGAPVTVMYDPDRPARAVIYELSGYTVG